MRRTKRATRTSPVKTKMPTSIFGRFQSALNRVLNNPIAVSAAALCLVLAMSGAENPFLDILKKIAAKIQTKPKVKWLGDFIANNPTPTLGVISMATSVVVSARQSEKLGWVLGVTCFAFLAPGITSWEFGVLSAALALFLQLRTAEDRLVLGGLAFASYLLSSDELKASRSGSAAVGGV